jgi:hypothetical protein
VNNSDVATPLFAFTGESDSIKIASSYLSQPIVLLPRLVTLNGTGNDAYYSGVSQFVITIWEAGLLNIDDPATSVVEELDESFIKNYVEINIEEGFITKHSFDSYVDVVKIAENYF